jgi:hypothetical protein
MWIEPFCLKWFIFYGGHVWFDISVFWVILINILYNKEEEHKKIFLSWKKKEGWKKFLEKKFLELNQAGWEKGVELNYCVKKIFLKLKKECWKKILELTQEVVCGFNRIPVIRYLPLRVTPIFSNKTNALNT